MNEIERETICYKLINIVYLRFKAQKRGKEDLELDGAKNDDRVIRLLGYSLKQML